MGHGDVQDNVGTMTKVFWLGLLSFSSIGMILFNKIAMGDFHHPMHLLFFQNALSIILNLFSVFIGLQKQQPLNWAEARRFIIPSLIFTVMLGSSLASLPYVTVASVIIFKNGSTLLVAAGDKLVFGKRFHRNAYLGLLLMLIGGIIYAMEDSSQHKLGYFFLFVNMVANATLNIYESHVVNDVANTPIACSTYINASSLPFVLGIAYYQQYAADSQSSVVADVMSASLSLKICMLITGCLGFCISNAYMTLFTIVPTTSIVVATNVNKIVSMLLGFVIFPASRNALNRYSWSGIAVCLGGAYLFAVSKKRAPGGNTGGAGGDSGAYAKVSTRDHEEGSLLQRNGSPRAVDDDESLEIEMASVMNEIDATEI